MIRRLSVFFIAFMSALLACGALGAEVVSPDRVLQPVMANDRLLITPRHYEVESFEAQMARDGWDVSKPVNKAFYNVQKIIQRQQLFQLEDEINAKVFEARRLKNSIDSSA